MLREKLADQLDAIINRYPQKQSAVLPLLEKAQEIEGHLNHEVMEEIGEILGLAPSEIYSVASFYSMFHLKPVGRRCLYFCRTLSCALAGGGELMAAAEERLGIPVGETTKDGKFSLFTFECLGSCGTAPVVMVDRKYHENMDLKKLEELIAQLSQDGSGSSGDEGT